MPSAAPSIVPLQGYPADEPFAVNAAFVADEHQDKVNLGIGVYRDEAERPWPLLSVEEAEKHLRDSGNPGRHEYLPVQGDHHFLALSRDVAFNISPEHTSYAADAARIVSAQTVSGTGANHVGAVYLARVLKPKTVWIPNISWGNHYTIWTLAGVTYQTYPYYNDEKRAYDHQATVKTLQKSAQPGDVVLLHACAHNPTGCDPSQNEWKSLAMLCYRNGLVPFFDMAYQGFASGNVAKDAWAVKHFFDEYPSMEFLVAQSFSKNFGLYGQRAGALHVVLNSEEPKDLAHNVSSTLCNLVRGEFSMAPRTGSDIVRTVLSSPTLRQQWSQDLKTMSGRIKDMRATLHAELLRLGTPGTWSHIVEQVSTALHRKHSPIQTLNSCTQNGMFTYTGLSCDQVATLRERHHLYMLSSGRISISGCKLPTPSNLAIVRSLREISECKKRHICRQSHR